MRFLFLTFLLASTPSFSWALANDTVIAHELTLIPTCGVCVIVVSMGDMLMKEPA